ncbi:DAK2 domain-containing protein [Shinella sp. NM-101]|uniref:DAK2 domain-containing protein n=1 Tax=Shinella sp. NM-101 TaxID=2744455 RepID=UPI001F282AAF|nr:DAK2 domain-containing protein [Shinella sp. NM-101]
MSITPAGLSSAVVTVNGAMGEMEQALNAADARLGDGDTGTMLARLFAGLAKTDISQTADVGAAFSALARAAAVSTGSSLGTLVATALMTLGRETKGRVAVDADEFATLLAAALDAMMSRGKASLGDKTVLDSIDAIVRRVSEEPTLPAAADAAMSALETFRSRPNRVGRARMFGDATIGVDDPGMLAVAKIAEALAKDQTADD